MSKVFIFLVLIGIQQIGFASEIALTLKPVSLDSLLKKKYLSATFTGIGGHSGESVKASLKNLTADTLVCFIAPGRRLFSIDTLAQDLLIVKEAYVVLAPNQTKVTNLHGYCCQSHHQGPKIDSKFTSGKMEAAAWIELANHINKNNYQPAVIQQAVWVLSNNHEISAVSQSEMAAILPLRQLLAKLKGIEVPWYTLDYTKNDTIVFTGQHNNFYGDYTASIKNNTSITLLLKNEKDEILAVFLKNAPVHTGVFKYPIYLKVLGWSKGTYTFYLYENDHILLQKKSFKL